ncbi:MAG: hypothetical protein ACREDR_39460 [Blastocatellia bacterium]
MEVEKPTLGILPGIVVRSSKRENASRPKPGADAFDDLVEEFAASRKIAAGLEAVSLVEASDFRKG